MDRDRQSVLTAIYIGADDVQEVVRRCLKATQLEFPGDDRYALCDKVTPPVETWLDDHGWFKIRPRSGDPPRLGRMLEDAICSPTNGTARVSTDIVWTIEHDVEIHPGARDAVSAILERNPKVAGIELVSVGADGQPYYPTDKKPRKPHDDPELQHIIPGTSLNCVCWRTHALREIDWSRIPDWPACDKMIARQVRAHGWELCIAEGYTCRHWYARARRHLPR